MPAETPLLLKPKGHLMWAAGDKVKVIAGKFGVTWWDLDSVQKGHNAEKPLVAPLQGAGFGGDFYPG